MYSPKTYRWVGDDLTEEDLRIGSVGPCFDKCDSRNWQGDSKQPVAVTLYERTEFKGNKTDLVLDGDGCVLIPRSLPHFRSMKISGDENSCIELHSASSCGGEFTQFRPGYLQLHDLFDCGLGGEHKYAAYSAKAISRCGGFCNKSVPDLNHDTGSDYLGKNTVTFFDHQGHYGHATNVNLTSGCVTLDSNNRYLSIRTYGQCVILYGVAGCVETQGYYTLQTARKPLEYYVEKLLTLTIPFLPKSIQLCDDEMPWDAESDDKTNQDSGLKDGYQQSTPKIWVIVMLCFVGMFVLAFTALGGAYISKYYENISYKHNVQRFNILYKPEST